MGPAGCVPAHIQRGLAGWEVGHARETVCGYRLDGTRPCLCFANCLLPPPARDASGFTVRSSNSFEDGAVLQAVERLKQLWPPSGATGIKSYNLGPVALAYIAFRNEHRLSVCSNIRSAAPLSLCCPSIAAVADKLNLTGGTKVGVAAKSHIWSAGYSFLRAVSHHLSLSLKLEVDTPVAHSHWPQHPHLGF